MKKIDRKDKVLECIDKEGVGLEIGPSHNPAAPKSDGYKVHVIDHATQDDLIEKYRELGVDTTKIEDVDYVWAGESYAELTGKRDHYDWIIASHVIEHTPDFVGFLNDCDTILKNEGVLSLAVPDKRYCFDHYRPITGLSAIIDSHIQKATRHTSGTVLESYLNMVSRAGTIAWNSKTTGDYDFVHSLTSAVEKMESADKKNAYLDVHAWCFTPHSFRLMIYDLFSLGLIPFQEVKFHPTKGSEFFVTLSRSGEGPNKGRVELLERIELELGRNSSIKDRIYAYVRTINNRNRSNIEMDRK